MLADWVRLGSRLVRLLRDSHHSDRHQDILDRILNQARASVDLRERRRASLPRPDYPPALPITSRKDEIVQTIRSNQVVVLVGETGSGKTTQLPKMCIEAGLGVEAKIGCTQPRRVAALSISRRIAEELNVQWGREVGCKIRFDDRSSPDTHIKVMTDGILLAETQGDPLLAEYNAIIVDEAHERSLNIDFLLGCLKGLLAKRPDLKLIITSATIETETFSKAFNDAPVIEVSGRVFPVEVVYMPLDDAREESGEITYIDAAARAVERVLCEPGRGDALVFMPSERDIRETSDLIRARCGDAAEIVPLFGRLTAGEQQRVFAPCDRTKIVVATNIAETSLTIPGIRFVIDAGLARISRYNPRTRIKRLPVEPVSQSSANQRKGRSGRVRDGVCIRLYSEADFNERPRFTQPEIQRANLAEVILRMKASRLGEIETFPFLNPPGPGAIQAGYDLLRELGALDEERELTELGRKLARLPIDPTLGRMLLQAEREHATRELLIIASGLSIQDPRERPLDQKDAATAAHRQFADPSSDFLTLLNIWNQTHDKWESLPSQNQRRKFCKTAFLSYNRMREWQDLHTQLAGALEDITALRINESNAAYDAIHRSILSGLLAHVSKREERNTYKGAGSRKLLVFPGSALYAREERAPRGRKSPPGPLKPEQKSSHPEWIMAGEIVETSQVFARTVAGVDPEWIIALGGHLCKTTHSNPHWSPEAGRVLVDEVITLHGLEVRRRKAAYSNINPEDATRIFVRSALVEDRLFPEIPNEDFEDARGGKQQIKTAPAPRDPHARFPFLKQNRDLREKIENWQTRVRHHAFANLDEALFAFYAERIRNVSSVHELNRFVGGLPDTEFLRATERDLIGDQELEFDSAAFPDRVSISGQEIPVTYAYDPGEARDGVTFKLGFSLAEVASPAALEWAVPGLREARVSELLKSLPKSIRKQLMPLQPKVSEIVSRFSPSGQSLRHDLGKFILAHYGVMIPTGAWADTSLPEHLRPNVEILEDDGEKLLASGKDIAALRKQLEKPPEPPRENPVWEKARAAWERFDLRAWTFGRLPESFALAPGVDAFPGLTLDDDARVNLVLFRALETARRASVEGVRKLVEHAVERELAWLQNDLRGMVRIGQSAAGFLSVEDMRGFAMECARNHVLSETALDSLHQADFERVVAGAKARLPGLAQRVMDLTASILAARQEVIRRIGGPQTPAPTQRTLTDLKDLGKPPRQTPPHLIAIQSELARLLPPDFLARSSLDLLIHYPRYLKALAIRAERAALNPVRDAERAHTLAPFLALLESLLAGLFESPEARALLQEFQWLLEEFRVSLFAQELGTAAPVSAKRLDALAQKLRRA
jgi:ATP-dependent helicase HrpA